MALLHPKYQRDTGLYLLDKCAAGLRGIASRDANIQPYKRLPAGTKYLIGSDVQIHAGSDGLVHELLLQHTMSAFTSGSLIEENDQAETLLKHIFSGLPHIVSSH